MAYILAPSILSADFGNIERDVKMLNKSEADWIHVDVMDGVFVPNISFGFPVIKAIKKWAEKPLDVHLMIVQPERYIKEFKDAGADILTVQYEACIHLHRTIQAIKAEGMKAGVAINPHTPISVLEDIIGDLDLVLIMSVNPGFGGQKFIANAYKKIRDLKMLIQVSRANTIIEVDGGVAPDNIEKLLHSGAQALVAGNAVFSTPNPDETIRQMKKITPAYEV
jgi:ribulose-phosphate 3-epimerase